MTGVETIARIRFEHFQNGKGIKRIARELGIARDTVRKVLRSGATEFVYRREVQPQRKLGAWIETLTGRVGYVVQPSTLLYVKGGAAWVRDNVWTMAGGTTIGNGIVTPTGWTLGAGAEFMFLGNWSVFAEYNYLGFGNNQVSLIPPAGAGIPINFNHNVQTILIGLNYRFGGPFSPHY